MKIVAPFGSEMVSGSYGSMTFSHNKGGLYIRARSIPTNPKTPYQQAIRAKLTYAASLWRTLDAEAKADWNSWATSNPRKNSMGEDYYLSGAQAFSNINVLHQVVGESTVETPPVLGPPQPLASLSCAATEGSPNTCALTFTRTPLTDDEWLYIKACKVFSPGISYVANLLKLVMVEQVAASPLDVLAEVELRCGTLTEDEILHFSVSVLSPEMLLSEPLICSCVVTAGV
jgi:hypothetical protein